ncbi:MAG: DDE-type integrase/transposase/recombinase [Cyanobacteria bacterium P01_C01_bin.120]
MVPRCASHQTLHNWAKRLRGGRPTALYGDYGHSRNHYAIERNPALKELCLSQIGRYPHIGPRQLWKLLATRFDEALIPTEAGVRRWLQWWKEENQQLFAKIANPDHYRNKYAPAVGSYSEGIERPNQKWELDSTIGDVMLRGYDGKLRRHAVVSCVDVFTRRVRMLVTPTSKSASVIALLRRCILEWGIPESIKTDNGKDYVSHHINHVTAALEIKHLTCQPFQPQQKPHVERFFKTWAHDLLELLPGFVGHNVADRKEIESRKSFAQRFGERGKASELYCEPHELQEFCDLYCEHIYGKHPHGTTGQRPELAIHGFTKREVPDPRILDLLMLPGGWATVTKGVVRKHRHEYAAAELAVLAGQRVHLRYPDDMSRLYIYEDETCQQLICVAECPELTGQSRQVASIAAKQAEKAINNAATAIKKLAASEDAIALSDELRDRLVAQGRKLEALPQGTVRQESKSFRVAAELQQTAQPKESPQEDDAAATARLQQWEAEQAREANDAARAAWRRDRVVTFFDRWRSLRFGEEIDPMDWQEMAEFIAGVRGKMPDHLIEAMAEEPLPDAAWGKLHDLVEEVMQKAS